MRRAACLVLLAACGPKPAPVAPPPPDDDPPPAAVEPPAVVWFTADGVGLFPIGCAGGDDGVRGGAGCLDAVPADLGVSAEHAGCTDAAGATRAFMPVDQELPWHPFRSPGAATDDPRDKRTHEVDLDDNGEPEKIELIPHDNRASYGRSITITDGHDPLMSDSYDPFPESADVQLLGTSDVDGDHRHELILYAPDESGFGVVVLEYWAAGEAYRMDCRTP